MTTAAVEAQLTSQRYHALRAARIETGTRIHETIEELLAMRLPELQAKFAEVVGEETRCPNKRYLVRRITEAVVEEATQAQDAATEPEENPEGEGPAQEDEENPEGEGPAQEDEATPEAHQAPRLLDLSVDELRAQYLEEVGRRTTSTNRRYLIWKIRQARKGKVTVGPVNRSLPGEGVQVEQKVLPLRMPAETVQAIDAAWKRMGLKSRMDLFRHALGDYFDRAGETEVADLLH